MRGLRLAILGSALTFCAARPAPDGTTAAPTTTTPAYIDTIQSIECVGSDRIRLSFQNQYSFMDAWDWGRDISFCLLANNSTSRSSYQRRRRECQLR